MEQAILLILSSCNNVLSKEMQPQNIANKSNLNLTLDPVIEIDKECREREKKNLKINPLDKSSRKILISMLAIGLVACLFPANLAAFAFTNGQPANSVLGQSVFTTSFSLSSSSVNRPAGEAFDSAGNLWVVDAKYNRVLEYAAPFSNGEAATLVIGQSSFTTNTAATTATGLNSPQGLAFDSAGNLWVVDGDNNRILEYLKGSGFTNGEAATLVIGQSSFTTNFAFMSAAGLDSPTTVAFDSTGNLWVADAGDSRVLEYLKGSGFTNGEAATTVLGQSSFTTDTRDTSATGLNVPISIAFDTSGNLWVADQNNERVVEYLKGSGFTNGEAATTVLGQSSFTTNTRDTSATGLQAPQGLAFDSAGNLWVADDENNRILEYLKGSGFTNGEAATTVLGQSSFTTNGNDVSATGLNSPQGLAFDSTHNLWVADEFNNRLLMYPQASLGTNGAAATTVIGQSDFTTRVALVASATSEASPAALAYDSSGNLWVADSANNRVLMYPQASLGTNGAAATVELGQPSGTAFTSSTANNGGISASTLSSPAGLAFDTLGNLWVADSANNRVLMYPQASLGTNGAAATV
ncbi:MAG: hypothetical protein KGI11_08145, partial [Thaumarchaeota archaeon]|nr:hypothetical protein [Nitrososphaerota archaeon]